MSFYNEEGYLEVLEKLTKINSKKYGRNGSTLSLFGVNYKFSLQDTFPLLTTKKMHLRGIFLELMWFLKGQTNSKELEKDGVKIWMGNSSRKYLDEHGFTDYPDGECGPIYGWQWRSFNASYPDKLDKGVDQLFYVIEEIKKGSRRAVISGWNPCQLKEMALPPCHIVYTFYRKEDELSCSMYMRSNDTFLGLPYNIASVGLLTKILATALGLKTGEIMISVCDAHLYSEHIEVAKQQVKRKPYKFPNIEITKPNKKLNTTEEIISWIESLSFNDIKINDYVYHPILRAPMIP